MRRVEGVISADLSFPSGVLIVEFDASRDPRDAVAAAVRAAGHMLETGAGETGPTTAPSWWQAHGHPFALGVSGALIAAGYAAQWVGVERVAVPAFVLAVLAGGLVPARRAWASLRVVRLDMNVLMSLAVVGALALGDFAEAAAIIFLFSLGQLLESRALDRTRRSVRDLMDLAPSLVRVRRHGQEFEVRIAEAVVGDLLVVKPGERIALDGVVRTGRTAVDEAPVTGESMPADKAPGDPVFAGSLNVNGLIEVDVTSAQSDSTLARLIHLVEEAQSQRAPSQTLVDSFTRYYTPIVVVGAVLVAVLPPLLDLGTWAEWAYRSLVVLVVSCPCALVISTPVAIVSAITRASRDGVLVKGGAHLETAARVRAVAFDKTGTLTCGRPEVTDIDPVGDDDPARVLRIAAALEAGSNHPIAAAVIRAAGAGTGERVATGLEDIAGRGVRAEIEGVAYSIGSPSLAQESGDLTGDLVARVHALEGQGKTVLVLLREGVVTGLMGVADDVRPEAPDVARRLRGGGIAHLVMLTGDNERTAAVVAEHAGLSEYRARLLPAQKMDAVRELQRSCGVVAMVGDGVNDAPALASADLGIAMGAAGSDTALETADVALMAPNLNALPGFFALGRRTVGVIRANVVFSVVTKAVVLIMAVFGYAPLWLAVFADMGVSLLVTLNGLRLLRSDTDAAA